MHLGKVIGEFNATPRVLPGIFGRRRSRRDVIGWRAWRVARDGHDGPWVLLSAVARHTWSGPRAYDATPPNPGDSGPRGFHTFSERKPAVHLAWMIGALPCASPSAIGPCEFLGRVVEHELGFRAQGLVIRSLALAERWLAGEIGKTVRRDLESRYRCEVSTLPDEEFGTLPGGIDGTSAEERAQSLLANAVISGTSLSRAAWAATAAGLTPLIRPAMPPPLLPIPRDQAASGEVDRHRQEPFGNWPVCLSMPTPLLPIPRDVPRARRRRRTWH